MQSKMEQVSVTPQLETAQAAQGMGRGGGGGGVGGGGGDVSRYMYKEKYGNL